MLETALFILALEVIVIMWVRRSYAARTRNELGGGQRQQPATSV
jgi:hypothetical protein